MEGRAFRPFGTGSVTVGVGLDRGLEARCFADEVVVDFPSVAPAVDRMRSAFLLDERGRALRTAIQLTRREAHNGATVPLNVAVRCTCVDCGGRGEAWAEPCGRCQGSGLECRPQQLQVMVPAGVLDGACFNFTLTPRHNPPTRVELRVLVA
jgi:DnaJ-class molecular chaperone